MYSKLDQGLLLSWLILNNRASALEVEDEPYTVDMDMNDVVDRLKIRGFLQRSCLEKLG